MHAMEEHVEPTVQALLYIEQMYHTPNINVHLMSIHSLFMLGVSLHINYISGDTAT